MHPILLDIGPLTLYAFGFFLALGFVAASIFIVHAAKEEGWSTEHILDILLITVLAGFLGARIFYILLHPFEFEGSFGRMVQFFRYPGFSYPGAIVGGLLGFLFSTRHFRRPWPAIADVFAIAILFGELFATIGCFLSACMIGSVTYMPWGVIIPGMIGRRHPIPFYLFLSAIVFLIVLFHIRHRLHFYGTKQSIFQPGVFFFLVGTFIGVRLSLLEFFRADSVYWMDYRLYGPMGFFMSGASLFFFYRQQERSIVEDTRILLRVLRGVVSGKRSIAYPNPWRSFVLFVRRMQLRGVRLRRRKPS